ncbi:hypothetical protein BV20DRAFT_288562 [Pilatotrama ljubarskyi]|nr:hypothetical protein BV20DRAFT_288562 [Pilatotrama ljubarskyi]
MCWWTRRDTGWHVPDPWPPSATTAVVVAVSASICLNVRTVYDGGCEMYHEQDGEREQRDEGRYGAELVGARYWP